MSVYTKLSVVALCAALFALVLKKQNPELALLVTLSGCVLCAVLLLGFAEPLLGFVRRLAQRAELDDALIAPMLKCVGIGLLTQITGTVCADAGETALAKLVELGGSILCVFAALPLMDAVLELIGRMTGA